MSLEVVDLPSQGQFSLESQFTNVLRIAEHVDLAEAIAHLATLENPNVGPNTTVKAYESLFEVAHNGVKKVFELLDDAPHDTIFALYGGGIIAVSHLGNPVINRDLICPHHDRLTIGANRTLVGHLGEVTFEPRTQVRASAWEFASAATSPQSAVDLIDKIHASTSRRALFVGNEAIKELGKNTGLDLVSLHIPNPGMVV